MKKLLSFTLAFLMAITLLPVLVNAQGLKNAIGELQKTATPAGVNKDASLSDVIGTVINVALSLVGIIFLLLMVYGGYLWLISRGDETEIEKSKEIIKAAIIGIVLVMSAYAITVLVTSRFGGGGGGRDNPDGVHCKTSPGGNVMCSQADDSKEHCEVNGSACHWVP